MIAAPAKFLPFHQALIEEEEINAVVAALRSGWITTGPKVTEFEEAFSRFLGVRHAIAVSSCTAALHLALDSIGLRENDEVLLPTLTFAATAEVVTYFRAKPVLVDSDPTYFNLDPEDALRKITPKTRAIIPVHFAGQPCPMDALSDLAQLRHLAVIDDAAHALPAKYHGEYVGTLSPLTAFSFYATKAVTTGEGGMVTTNDDSLATRIRTMRLHGMSRDAWKRYDVQGSWRYDITEAGFKYNLTDPQAALGLVQLGKCNAMWRRRAQLAQRYTNALKSFDSVRCPSVMADVQHAWHLYVILINPTLLRIHRDQVIEELRNRGIGTSVHFIPLHMHSYYRRHWGYHDKQFPVAENYFDRCISLPLYPGMTDDDADRVIESLADIFKEFRR